MMLSTICVFQEDNSTLISIYILKCCVYSDLQMKIIVFRMLPLINLNTTTKISISLKIS